MSSYRFFAFLVAVLSSSLSYSILILIKNHLREDIPLSDLIYAGATVFLFIFFGLMVVFKKYGWLFLKKIYQDEIKKESMNKLKEDFHVENVFPNMESCMESVCDRLSSEKNISIFVQIGVDILSRQGKFYECLRKNISPESIRILHSSRQTPYLSSREASSRAKGKLEEWTQDLRSSEQYGKQLENLYDEGVFKSRAHHEGYYWRIFLFDEVCYVQPYVYKSDNSDRAPVFEIKKSESSIYNTFETFFNNKWREYKPNTYYVNDFLKEASPVSVTALIRYDSLYVFSVPKRYASKKEMYVQAVGGKTENNETYKSALIREAEEEINAKIKVYSSSYTTYIYEGGIQLSEKFQDDPAPYIIYKRSISDDTRDKRVTWILLFNAELMIGSLNELTPENETEAIVCLSREMLSKLADPTITLKVRDITNSEDGSKIISRKKYSPNMILKPKGMVNSINIASFPSFK